MRPGSAHLIMAVFVLATALTLAEDDAGYPNPPASMVPPAPFVTTPVPITSPHNTTTANMTTTTPAPHNTTTTNITTAAPTTHNTTTANITSTTPASYNTTTPASHNTTTPASHNTTTPASHNTTTPASHNTTTPASHNTTTPASHNTTTPPIPMPTPTTNITVGNYTVKDGNKLCIMVQAAIQVHVNNSKQHMVGTYVVPGNAISNGNCERNSASLKIILKEGYISMDFIKNDTTDVVFVSAVAVNLSYAFKSGELSHLDRKSERVQLFSMATSHSYSCKSESVSLGDDTYLEFRQERIQAFNFTNNQFGPFDLCKADKPNYQVAIGVGVALLILIIIVILANLISRRKRTDGYQTL